MFIRRPCAVYCASLFAGVSLLMTFSVSTRAAAGFVRVGSHYDAVVERHREERLRDEQLWEERRQQATRDDYRQRAERARRAHAANERAQLD